MQVSTIGLTNDLSTISSDASETMSQAEGLLKDGVDLVDDIYSQQEFMNSVLTNASPQSLSVDELMAYQASMKTFAVETQIVSKAVNVAIQGIQTLTQLQ